MVDLKIDQNSDLMETLKVLSVLSVSNILKPNVKGLTVPEHLNFYLLFGDVERVIFVKLSHLIDILRVTYYSIPDVVIYLL